MVVSKVLGPFCVSFKTKGEKWGILSKLLATLIGLVESLRAFSRRTFIKKIKEDILYLYRNFQETFSNKNVKKPPSVNLIYVS